MIVKTTMHLDSLCAAALLPHFQSGNLECSSVSGGCLSVPGLAMDFVASEGHVLQGGLSVVFDARARNSSKGGILVTSVGTGDSDESAAADAASQWAMGVLPVIVSYILRSHVCEVEKLPMIVGVEDSQERYGWTAHLGPVIGRAFGGSGSADSLLGDLSQSAAYIPVFHVLHPHAAHRSLMWIETFAARYYTEGKVDATCRLNNKDFEEGRRALMGWASNWETTGAALLTKRQFVLFEPTTLEQLKNSDNLSQKLNDAMSSKIQ
jgi:hypothetical protein